MATLPYCSEELKILNNNLGEKPFIPDNIGVTSTSGNASFITSASLCESMLNSDVGNHNLKLLKGIYLNARSIPKHTIEI